MLYRVIPFWYKHEQFFNVYDEVNKRTVKSFFISKVEADLYIRKLLGEDNIIQDKPASFHKNPWKSCREKRLLREKALNTKLDNIKKKFAL